MPRIAGFSAISLTLLAAACQRVPLLAPTGSTITLTASTTALPMNGTTQLIAQLLEASGTPPHSGTHVIFTTTLGTIEPSEAETDVNGRAVATFKAGNANGTATITASSGGASVAAANVVKIAVGAAAVSSVTTSANPTTISSQGGSSTIMAKVFDGGGNVLPGIAVTFSTDNGSVSPALANTDANGVATSTLTTNRTAKVTASAGVSTTTSGSTPTTSTPSSSVTVTVNTTGAITIGTVAPSAPTVGQTVAVPLTYPAGAAGTSPVTSVRVDWGDGRIQNYSGQPNVVTHVYGAVGSYLVVVTGIDALGDTSTTSTVIPVAPKPLLTVDISTSGAATAGNPVTFTVAATPSAGAAITSVTIDFGDGGPAVSLPGNVKSVVHTFAQSGTYQVTAVATDSSGATGTGTTIIAVGGVTANFSTTNGASGSKTVSFSAAGSTSSSQITKYEWDFGDGTTGTGVTVSNHVFPSAGPFQVRLTVTDSAGRVAITTQSVTPP